MNLPKLTDCVSKDKMVFFDCYADNTLWYVCDNGFRFPIDCSDAGTGVFKHQDKSIFFMRWIRKHLEFLRDSYEEKE